MLQNNQPESTSWWHRAVHMSNNGKYDTNFSSSHYVIYLKKHTVNDEGVQLFFSRQNNLLVHSSTYNKISELDFA
jgi:hypothetical protein